MILNTGAAIRGDDWTSEGDGRPNTIAAIGNGYPTPSADQAAADERGCGGNDLFALNVPGTDAAVINK